MLGFVGKAVKGVAKAAKGAAKGVAGVGKNTVKAAGAVVTLKPGKAVKAAKAAGKSAAGAVSAVTNNHLIQSVWPPVTVPAAVVSGAVKNGKKGATAAIKNFGKNPIVKAQIKAAGVVFPPIAPASASAVASMEASGRIIDDLESGDPKRIAGASVRVAGTALLAAEGNPGAKRAIDTIKKAKSARALALGAINGNPKAEQAIAMAKRKGTAAAKNGLALVQTMAAREALKAAASTNPAVRAKASKIVTKLQLEAPNLLAAVRTAMTSPKGVKIGQFAVIRTGRILRDGRPIRSAPPKKQLAARAR
jgi:hypothetical protein